MASIDSVNSYISTAQSKIDEALAELSSLVVLDNDTNTTQNIKTILQGIKNDLTRVQNDISNQKNLIETNRNILGV